MSAKLWKKMGNWESFPPDHLQHFFHSIQVISVITNETSQRKDFDNHIGIRFKDKSLTMV